MTKLGIYGSTGSIGTQALGVVEDMGEEISVEVLVAKASLATLLDQVKGVRPPYVALVDDSLYVELKGQLPRGTVAISSSEAVAMAGELDISLNAITGFAGLQVTRSSLLGGKRLALANKESIIAAGDLVRDWMRSSQAELIPVDSEHSAIFQCLGADGATKDRVHRLLLTASGGPFRTLSSAALEAVTKEDALKHPTWAMGDKITIDSSTLVNKGLEVIEAHYLFDVPYSSIEVVVHPQSVVHSMVSFKDGTVLAQLSQPDMRLPISLALSYPARSVVAYGSLDFSKSFSLTFEPPDVERFPALGIAFEAGIRGGAAPCWFNAANEVFVQAFLDGRISWKSISQLLAISMNRFLPLVVNDIDEVIQVDAAARALSREILKEHIEA